MSDTTTVVEEHDPYQLDPADIMEPPKGWRASFKYLGPGLIMSASIVGSGELIATTVAGAKVGFALLWLVILSTFVKVAIQIELAKWTIATGEAGLTGFNRIPPKLGRTGWMTWAWLLMALAKITQMGGVVGGSAVSLSLLFPFGGDPLNKTSLTIWTIVVVAVSIAILFSSKYGVVETICSVFVVAFTIITVAIAFGLPFTPFAYGWAEIASGLTFAMPALAVAVSMFGITGVGSDEITFYTYWCVEKGYARWAGPNDGSPEWQARAEGWIKVMKKDSWLSWVIYTVSTLAFYIMGAAVLHPQGLLPEGNAVITTLARMYTDSIGPWAMHAFLICAFTVLISTLWAAMPSHSRLWANFFANVGVFDWKNDPKARMRWIRIFTVFLPIAWAVMYLVVQSPVLMVQIGGIATGIFLLVVVVGVWYLRKTEMVDSVKGSKAWLVLLVISSAAIGILGLYTIAGVFGFSIG
ncbi:Nramp family divalent metal transporter [Propionimicrobium sp. PCR01-08-3]|uniref:Nramp family divalent metal transporter n=1 Tax=Propionimicrobium sp. PCR01-08-3 TaxID=3052086 RepID=UPI00255CC4BC|nr:Nramp family divalent metal transporter [Propionimicrobium sp. PCR01-08-3]WIY83069.1 Nramp family divalent metal transporter [Propionimicrobium sp. PCR01-08-3]